LVLTRWAPLVSDRAFRILTRMAHTALDTPNDNMPAGIFTGGRELLALTLHAERNGTQEAAYRTVKRAIAELIEVGAIERTNNAFTGRRGCYRLTLENRPRIDRHAVDNRVD